MIDNLHIRAQKLFAQSLVEGLAPNDQSWLSAHLHVCAACAQEIASTQDVLGSLRTVHAPVPRDLVSRTQLRVRLRAAETAHVSTSSAVLWIITVFSWLLGVVTAPFLWRIFAWAGTHLGLPKPAIELGFVLWWTFPALCAIAAVLYQRSLTAAPHKDPNF